MGKNKEYASEVIFYVQLNLGHFLQINFRPQASSSPNRTTSPCGQTNRYASELREFKQQMVAQLEALDKNKETLRIDLDSVGTRVDRVEREMDYLETQNGALPCVDVDDKLVEQQVTVVKEKNKAKYAKLSGEQLSHS